jgi:ubiquinol-cytochrome c reductase cytochrome b subunit
MAAAEKQPVTVTGVGPLNGPLSDVLTWVDQRFPLMSQWREHMSEYYAPKNFNFWYYFGSLAIVVLVIQIVTGIFLTMHYKPDAAQAFASVEYIMRDVPGGWLIRYMHSTGASFFFIVIYLHMFRGMMYGSYRKPRELVWIVGMAIYLCLMAEAFFGYLLPWGQMSYWGAQVIVNLFDAIPFIGPPLAEWIRGDYVVSDATLNRFFSFHVIAIPLVLLALVGAHILALHEVGSNNPDGVEIKKVKDPNTGRPLDGVPFHPYYTVGKDMFGMMVFLALFATVMFFMPELGGYFLEYNNFIPADPLKTPAHIAPVWYFTPFYSILRAVTEDFVWVLAVVAIAYALLLIRSRLAIAVSVLVAAMLAAWLVQLSGLTALLAQISGSAIPWHGMAMAAVAGVGLLLVPSAIGLWTRRLAVAVTVLVLVGLFSLDAKVWGVAAMGVSTLIFFALPWLDQSPVKSIRYKGALCKSALAMFVITFLVLGFLGTLTVTEERTLAAQVFTLLYFAFFLLMPWYTRMDKTKPEPERVTR